MEETEKAYYAGIFDGEGTIGIARNKPCNGRVSIQHTFSCAVAITDEQAARDFLVFGGSLCKKHHFPKHPKWKPQWTWSIASNQAVVFLEILLPYLRLKAGQARLGIEFQVHRRNVHLGRNRTPEEELTKRDWYWRELRRLKDSRSPARLQTPAG